MTKHIVLLQALASTPKNLVQLLETVDESAIHHRASPDQWSVADVLSHLIDVEARYISRLKRVIQEDHPTLPALWPDEAAHDTQATLPKLLNHFEHVRTKTLAFLKEIVLDDWQRPATHENWGETNFHALVQNLVHHDAEHLSQITKIREALSKEGQFHIREV
jgi:uncharacterized damage-inducible protein DinB